MKRFLLVLLLSGCASHFEDKLNAYIGMSETDLVRSWGTPSSVFDYDNIRIIRYSKTGATAIPYNPNFGYAVVPMGCTVEFTIEETGVVSQWRYQGNNCY